MNILVEKFISGNSLTNFEGTKDNKFKLKIKYTHAYCKI